MMYSLKQLLFCCLEWRRMKKISQSKSYSRERQKSRIIRLVHSIEKGMCLEEPRLGFGIAKLNKLFNECESFEEKYGTEDFCLQMVYGAVRDYLSFHESHEYSNADITQISERFNKLQSHISPISLKVGGYQHVYAKNNEVSSFSKLLLNRHSIRDFEAEHVVDADIKAAISAAQMCPSACNRQAYRAYVIPSSKLLELYNNNLSGIGGFAGSADKFILITGKISYYDFSEYNQFIVSSSIFASYLSLTLLDKNIGSCIVQRPLRCSKQNKKIMHYCHIPDDEQIVVMLAIGYLKKEYNAPISGRFPVDEIVKFIE